MQKNAIIIGIIALLAGAGGGFYGGIKYQQSKVPAKGQFSLQNMGAQAGQLGQFRMPNGTRAGNSAGFVAGEILSRDDQSITVKDRNGGSKIVFYSGSTGVGKTATGTPEDLIVGAEVIVSGTTGNDGSITAQNISISPLPQNGVRLQGQ